MTRGRILRAVLFIGFLAFAWWGAGLLSVAVVVRGVPERTRELTPIQPVLSAILSALGVVFAFGVLVDSFRRRGDR